MGKMSNRIFNLLWLTPTFSYGKRNIICVKEDCFAIPKIIRELKDECPFCGVKLKLWSYKKATCPKCGRVFD